MGSWYRVTVESDDPQRAIEDSLLFERSLSGALRIADPSGQIAAFYDWLPNGRGRVFWLSPEAFDAAPELARQYDAAAYPGLVDMRFLAQLPF